MEYNFIKNIPIKQQLIMKSLIEFYNTENINIIIPILSGNTKLSLRIIDWFVTNYSKKNNILYDIFKNDKKYQFNVFTSYKSQLKSYSKRYFDPFCRRNRINLYFNEKKILTTIGQLNFFKWAINNNVLDYIYTKYDIIDKDMNISMINHTIKKSKNVKRKELSISSYKGLNITDNPITLYFD